MITKFGLSSVAANAAGAAMMVAKLIPLVLRKDLLVVICCMSLPFFYFKDTIAMQMEILNQKF
jgi:hypothetical protein